MNQGRWYCLGVKGVGSGAREKWVQVLALPQMSFLNCLSLNSLVCQMETVKHLLHHAGRRQGGNACTILSKVLYSLDTSCELLLFLNWGRVPVLCMHMCVSTCFFPTAISLSAQPVEWCVVNGEAIARDWHGALRQGHAILCQNWNWAQCC